MQIIITEIKKQHIFFEFFILFIWLLIFSNIIQFVSMLFFSLLISFSDFIFLISNPVYEKEKLITLEFQFQNPICGFCTHLHVGLIVKSGLQTGVNSLFFFVCLIVQMYFIFIYVYMFFERFGKFFVICFCFQREHN